MKQDQSTDGLLSLEHAIARDLSYLNFPPANWVKPKRGPKGEAVFDALIVGGGMCGLAAHLALRRLGIGHIHMIDEAAPGLEGPWVTFARMQTLRSPKHLTGPALGLPNLTFRAWFEAQFGNEAWEALGRIPREQWAEYLKWFARISGAATESNLKLSEVSPADEWICAHVIDHRTETARKLLARRVVLATGRDALAQPRVPPCFKPFRGELVFHTSDAPSRLLLKDKRVVVVGLAASAFDYAAEALEAGAKHVQMLGRGATIPRINKAKQVVYSGFSKGFANLPDDERFAIFRKIASHGVPPPRDSVLRVSQHSRFDIALKSEVTAATFHEGRLALTTASGRYMAEVVILGTGFHIDIANTSFLKSLGPGIKTWRDCAGLGGEHGELFDFPYLGPGFEFQSRSDGAIASAISRIYCFNHAAMVSLGNLANDIPAVSEGAERLADAIAASLFLEDRAEHRADLWDYDEAELLGDEIPDRNDW